MKKLIAFVVMLSFMFATVACGNSSINDFVGTWKTSGTTSTEVIIKEDGTFEWILHTVLGDATENGIVEVDKSKSIISFYIDSGNGINKNDWLETKEFQYFLSGNTLYFYKPAIMEEPWYTFKKQFVTDQSEPNATSEPETTSSETTNESGSEAVSADSTYGSILQLMNDVIGKNRAEAEKMIGEFFGVEIEDMSGLGLDAKINDIPTTLYVYVQMLTKDSARFNGMSLYADPDKDLVRGMEINLVNKSYAAVEIEDTAEFRDEIRKQFNDIKAELDNTYGEAYKAEKPQFDEDSFSHYYKLPGGGVAYCELRDFTQEGGNGRVSLKLIFADNENVLAP